MEELFNEQAVRPRQLAFDGYVSTWWVQGDQLGKGSNSEDVWGADVSLGFEEWWAFLNWNIYLYLQLTERVWGFQGDKRTFHLCIFSIWASCRWWCRAVAPLLGWKEVRQNPVIKIHRPMVLAASNSLSSLKLSTYKSRSKLWTKSQNLRGACQALCLDYENTRQCPQRLVGSW